MTNDSFGDLQKVIPGKRKNFAQKFLPGKVCSFEHLFYKTPLAAASVMWPLTHFIHLDSFSTPLKPQIF